MASGASGSGNVEKKVGELEKVIASPITPPTTEEAKQNAKPNASATTATANTSAASSPPQSTTVGIGNAGFCSSFKSCITSDYGRSAATGAVILMFLFGFLKCAMGESDDDDESLLEKEQDEEKEEKVKEDYLNYSRMSAM